MNLSNAGEISLKQIKRSTVKEVYSQTPKIFDLYHEKNKDPLTIARGGVCRIVCLCQSAAIVHHRKIDAFALAAIAQGRIVDFDFGFHRVFAGTG